MAGLFQTCQREELVQRNRTMATAETAVLPSETMQTAHRNRQIPHGERMQGIPSMGTCDEPKGMVSNGTVPAGAQGHGRGVVQKAGTYPNSNTEMTETAGCHKRHAPWCERGRNPPTRFCPCAYTAAPYAAPCAIHLGTHASMFLYGCTMRCPMIRLHQAPPHAPRHSCVYMPIRKRRSGPPIQIS